MNRSMRRIGGLSTVVQRLSWHACEVGKKGWLRNSLAASASCPNSARSNTSRDERHLRIQLRCGFLKSAVAMKVWVSIALFLQLVLVLRLLQVSSSRVSG